MNKILIALSALLLPLFASQTYGQWNGNASIWEMDFEKGMEMFDPDSPASIADSITGITYYGWLDENQETLTNNRGYFDLDTTSTATIDTLIYLQHGIFPTFQKRNSWGGIMDGYWNDDVSVEDYASADPSGIDELAALGVDVTDNEKFFRWSAEEGREQVNDYDATLLVRGLPIKPKTSYRVTFYMKVDAPDAFVDVRLMRGWFESEKPFTTVKDKSDASHAFIGEVKGSDWIDDITGEADSRKLNHWQRYTFMYYYDNDSLGNALMHHEYYWGGKDFRWFDYFQDGKHQLTPEELEMFTKQVEVYDEELGYMTTVDSVWASNIVQPDNFFLRFSFRGGSTDYYVDNITLVESSIGTAEVSGDIIRLNFGYKTNIGNLCEVSPLGRIAMPDEMLNEVFTLTMKGQDGADKQALKIVHAEYQSDGMVYLWLEDSPAEGDRMWLSFHNPDDERFQIRYTDPFLYPYFSDTEWVSNGKTVRDFTNEEVLVSNFQAVPTVDDVPPAIVSAEPVEKSFNLGATDKCFVFKTTRPVYTGAATDGRDLAISLIDRNGLEEPVALADVSFNTADSTLTATIPNSTAATLNGIYDIVISNLRSFSMDGSISEFVYEDVNSGEPVRFEYTWGTDFIYDTRTTEGFYYNKLNTAYTAASERIGNASIRIKAITDFEEFLAPYEPGIFIASHHAPQQYLDAEAAINYKLAEVEDAIAVANRLFRTMTKAEEVLDACSYMEGTPKYEAIRTKYLECAGKDYTKIDTGEIADDCSELSAAVNELEVIPQLTAQARALYELCDELGVDFGSKSAYIGEAMANLDSDNDTLVNLLKLHAIKGIYQQLARGSDVNGINVSGFIRNPHFYTGGVLGKDIERYDAQYHRETTEEAYRIVQLQEWDNVFPGWTIYTDHSSSWSWSWYTTSAFGVWNGNCDDEWSEIRGTYVEEEGQFAAGALGCDWSTSFNIRQDITGLPAGQYTLVMPFSSTAQISLNDYIFAGDDEIQCTDPESAVITTEMSEPGNLQIGYYHSKSDTQLHLNDVNLYLSIAYDPWTDYSALIAEIERKIAGQGGDGPSEYTTEPNVKSNILDDDSYNFNGSSLGFWNLPIGNDNSGQASMQLAHPGYGNSYGALKLSNSVAAEIYDAQAAYDFPNYLPCRRYRLTFYARAEKADMSLYFGYQKYSYTDGDCIVREIALSTEWKQYSITFDAQFDDIARMYFDFGHNVGDIFIDQVSLLDIGKSDPNPAGGNASTWEMDFEAGPEMLDGTSPKSIADEIESIGYYAYLTEYQSTGQTLDGWDTIHVEFIDTAFCLRHETDLTSYKMTSLWGLLEWEDQSVAYSDTADVVLWDDPKLGDPDGKLELRALGVNVDDNSNFLRWAAAGERGKVADYRANLYLRGLNVRPGTSYRLTFYMKADAPDAFVDVRLCRGWTDSDKPFYMADGTEFKKEIDGSEWVDQTTGEMDSRKVGHFQKYTVMFYYDNNELQEDYLQRQYYWGSKDGRWATTFDALKYKLTPEQEKMFTKHYEIEDPEYPGQWEDMTEVWASKIQQPDKYFMRFGFRGGNTVYELDEISLEESTIGGAEINDNLIRLDFGYETNIASLCDATGRLRVPLDRNIFTLKSLYDEPDMPAYEIADIEYSEDGYVYLWLPEGAGLIPDDSLTISFNNPVYDDAYAIRYTGRLYPFSSDAQWVAAGKYVMDFEDEPVRFSPFPKISGADDIVPKFVSAEPAEKSFALTDADRTFAVRFTRSIFVDEYDGKKLQVRLQSSNIAGVQDATSAPVYYAGKVALDPENDSIVNITFNNVPATEYGIANLTFTNLRAAKQGFDGKVACDCSYEEQYGEELGIEYTWGTNYVGNENTTEGAYYKRVSDAYSADTAYINATALKTKTITDFETFLKPYQPEVFILTHKTPQEYLDAEKVLMNELDKVKNAMAMADKLAAVIAKAEIVLDTATTYLETAKYAAFYDAYNNLPESFEKSTAKEIEGYYKSILSTMNNFLAVSELIAQARNLYAIADMYDGFVTGDNYESIMENLDEDNADLVAQLKLRAIRGIYKELQAGRSIDSIDASGFITNPKLYQSGILGQEIEKYTAGWHTDINQEAYRIKNSENADARYTTVFPGWSVYAHTDGGWFDYYGVWTTECAGYWGSVRGGFVLEEGDVTYGELGCDWSCGFNLEQTITDVPAGEYTLFFPTVDDINNTVNALKDYIYANLDTVPVGQVQDWETGTYPADSVSVTTKLDAAGDISFAYVHKSANRAMYLPEVKLYLSIAYDPATDYQTLIDEIEEQIGTYDDPSSYTPEPDIEGNILYGDSYNFNGSTFGFWHLPNGNDNDGYASLKLGHPGYENSYGDLTLCNTHAAYTYNAQAAYEFPDKLPSRKYRLTFYSRTDKDSISVHFGYQMDNFVEGDVIVQKFNISTEWKQYSIEFDALFGNIARMYFDFGYNAGNICIDRVVLKDIGEAELSFTEEPNAEGNLISEDAYNFNVSTDGWQYDGWYDPQSYPYWYQSLRFPGYDGSRGCMAISGYQYNIEQEGAHVFYTFDSPLKPGRYSLKFVAKSLLSTGNPMDICLESDNATTYAAECAPTYEWQEYCYVIDIDNGNTTALSFYFGSINDVYAIDRVCFENIDESIHIRKESSLDFDTEMPDYNPSVYLEYTNNQYCDNLGYWRYQYGSLDISTKYPLHLNKYSMYVSPYAKYYSDANYEGVGAYDYYRTPYNSTPLIVSSGNVSADSISVTYMFYPETWQFITFPFDVRVGDITPMDPGTLWVVRGHSGKNRAAGMVTDDVWYNLSSSDILEAGKGYILHCYTGNYSPAYFDVKPYNRDNGIFTSSDRKITLEENLAEFEHNRSWNLIGNPYPSFFNIKMTDFEAPIQIWNSYSGSYTAYSPIDDDYILSPGEAFFVQRPIDQEFITFYNEGRQTDMHIRHLLMSTGTSRSAEREIFNVILRSDSLKDHTRVVLNENASASYEISRDASKFAAMNTRVPQIWSIEGATHYAINERPTSNGEITLGIHCGFEGNYSLAVDTHSKATVILHDNYSGISTILDAESGYMFHSEAGDYNDRFYLTIINGNTTGIGDIDYEAGGQLYNIMGIPVDAPQGSGLYIQNGHKIFIK